MIFLFPKGGVPCDRFTFKVDVFHLQSRFTRWVFGLLNATTKAHPIFKLQRTNMTWHDKSSHHSVPKKNKQKTVIRSHQSSSSQIFWNGNFPPKTASVVSNIFYFHPECLGNHFQFEPMFLENWVAWNHQLEDVDLQILPVFFSSGEIDLWISPQNFHQKIGGPHRWEIMQL